MCGIAGVSFTNTESAGELLRTMAATLTHRGPDGEGFFTHENMGLAHRRLAIIDLSTGAQPLFTPNKKLAVVVNGEIYNYKSLRQNLQKEGVTFATQSDCEPPLYLYQRHGDAFTEHLHGMYALALVDVEKNQLILARDPYGIKPLYYATNSRGFAFASEPRALLAAGFGARRVNAQARAALFNRQFTAGTQTLFEGIFRIQPGEVLVVQQGKIVRRAIHAPTFAAAAPVAEPQALARLNTHWAEAVAAHMQADVPYGAFLSGGIDSTFMVAHMQKLLPRNERVKTFSIGFASPDVPDERTAAQTAAEHLQTTHHSTEFTEDDFWNLIPTLANAMDDLVADPAILPTLKLAEFAKKSVKVVLSGEGGDEIFAGYGRYRQPWWKRMFNNNLRGTGDAAALGNIWHDKTMRHWRDAPLPCPAHLTHLQKLQHTDITTWLPDDLLLKADRALMWHGLEGRVPFLGDTFARFAFSLPDSLKIKGKHGKWLLKTALNNLMPAANVWAKKRGFSVPLVDFINRKRPAVQNFLTTHAAVQEVLDVEKLRDLLNFPLNKKTAKIVFTLLCYAHWHNIHIAGKTPVEKL